MWVVTDTGDFVIVPDGRTGLPVVSDDKAQRPKQLTALQMASVLEVNGQFWPQFKIVRSRTIHELTAEKSELQEALELIDAVESPRAYDLLIHALVNVDEQIRRLCS